MSREVQQVKKQHPVPQNIMSVEFKLIGDMTVRQFFYVAAGAILGILFFKSGLPFLIKWPFTLLFSLGGAALAFVPLQERGLDVWFKSFIRVFGVPTQMVWKKDPTPPAFFLSDYAKAVNADLIAMTPTKSRHRLHSYLEAIRNSASLDPHDRKERELLAKLNFDLAIPPQLAGLFEEQSPRLLLPAKEAFFSDNTFTGQTSPFIKNVKKDRPLRNIALEKEIILPKDYKDIPVKVEVVGVKKDGVGNAKDEENALQKKTEELKKTMGRIRKDKEKKESKKILQDIPKEKKEGPSPLVRLTTIFLRPKKLPKTDFANVSPSPQESDNSLFAKIPKGDEGEKREQKEEKGEETATIVRESEVTNPKPEPQISKIEIVDAGVAKSQVEDKIKKTAMADVNILKGHVLDSNDRIVEGALLLVKDSQGDPERATKTNALGEFITVTPLNNGKYSIETRYEGMVFNVVNFIATGAKLDYLTIKAKATHG
ncbi:PrgI family protein [Candidatus Parcubacteria bacterium]|nr:PrgI family protein [Patescibacteria group bacterium]MCG2689285.1 PrgI family protein [Candidatus Parcubacteria bacterium]